jgi:hypothetical protein
VHAGHEGTALEALSCPELACRVVLVMHYMAGSQCICIVAWNIDNIHRGVAMMVERPGYPGAIGEDGEDGEEEMAGMLE